LANPTAVALAFWSEASAAAVGADLAVAGPAVAASAVVAARFVSPSQFEPLRSHCAGLEEAVACPKQSIRLFRPFQDQAHGPGLTESQRSIDATSCVGFVVFELVDSYGYYLPCRVILQVIFKKNSSPIGNFGNVRIESFG